MTDSKAKRALEGLTADEFLEVLEKATPEQLHAIALLGQDARVSTPIFPRWFAQMMAAPTNHKDVLSILGWWERRRPAYNAIVGACGLFTLAVLASVFHAPVQTLVVGTLLYGGAANVCYTLGAPAEMVAWLLWRDKASHVGPILLSLGTIFSVTLTLGTGFLVLVSWLAVVLSWGAM